MTDTERDLIQRMARELDLYRQMARDDCTSTHPFADEARALRRPKPPSLKEQALDDLKTMTTVPPGMSPLAPETVERIERIRRALEALPDE